MAPGLPVGAERYQVTGISTATHSENRRSRC